MENMIEPICDNGVVWGMGQESFNRILCGRIIVRDCFKIVDQLPGKLFNLPPGFAQR